MNDDNKNNNKDAMGISLGTALGLVIGAVVESSKKDNFLIMKQKIFFSSN